MVNNLTMSTILNILVHMLLILTNTLILVKVWRGRPVINSIKSGGQKWIRRSNSGYFNPCWKYIIVRIGNMDNKQIYCRSYKWHLHQAPASHLQYKLEITHYLQSALWKYPTLSKNIAKRRLRFAGHCARSFDQPASDLLFWVSPGGKTQRGYQRLTYPDVLKNDTGLRDP